MRHIFVQLLGIDVVFTTKVEDFIKHAGPKITYTKQPLQNEFFIRSNDLLFEQGINDLPIHVYEWEGTPCFFRTDGQSAIPFDIFSASFYLLSRYEEYLPHVKDALGRFPPEASVAFQHGFLDRPVVDLWVRSFFRALKERFPDIDAETKSYRFTAIVNVTVSHKYALRGPLRSLAGLLADISRFRFSRMAKRVQVWFDRTRDPYDNFSALMDLHKKYTKRTMFFFQFAENATHDRNISIHRNRFRYLIKSVADYSIVSLSASRAAANELETLKLEKQRLSNLINRPVKYSRMRYNRVQVPHTYRNLVDAEFTEDYTMGYTYHPGFRAGTCSPFAFYDINLEVRQPIKIYPFAVCDHALRKYKRPQEVFDSLDPIYQSVKTVKGHLIMIFSNELLGRYHKIVWMQLYSNLLKRYYV
ncbi:MAG: polysaccharide deacetylase family protein [Bacteroidota bacterium]